MATWGVAAVVLTLLLVLCCVWAVTHYVKDLKTVPNPDGPGCLSFSALLVCSENIPLWLNGAVVKQGLMSSLNEMFVLRYLNWDHVADTKKNKKKLLQSSVVSVQVSTAAEGSDGAGPGEETSASAKSGSPHSSPPPPPLTQRLLQLILDKWCCWAFLSSLSWPGSNTYTWFIQLITNLTQRNLFAAAARSNAPPPDTFRLHAPKDDDEATAGINEKQTIWQLYLCCIQLRGRMELMKNWRLWTCFLHQWGKSF